VKATRAGEVLLSVAASGLSGYYDAVGRLPEVEAITPLAGVPVAAFGPDGKPDPNISAGTVAATDDRLGFTMQRQNLLAGRMYNPAATDEVVASLEAAKVLHLHVGSRLPMFLARNSDYTRGKCRTFRI